MTRAQAIELERTVIDFILDQFASKPFLNVLLNMKAVQVRSMQPIYLSLFKCTLSYAQQCAAKAVRNYASSLVPFPLTKALLERATRQEGKSGQGTGRTVDQSNAGRVRDHSHAQLIHVHAHVPRDRV